MAEGELNYNKPENIYTHRHELLDKGNDFEVYAYDNNYVVKLPNRDRQSNRPYNNMSQEFYDTLVSDHTRLKEIFGDNMADSYFFPPNKEQGANYRIVQQRFKRAEFIRRIPDDEMDAFIIEHKEQFRELVTKARTAQKEFGVPIDLTSNNVVFHEGKLIITENDCPTLRYQQRGDMHKKIEKDEAQLAHIESLVK